MARQVLFPCAFLPSLIIFKPLTLWGLWKKLTKICSNSRAAIYIPAIAIIFFLKKIKKNSKPWFLMYLTFTIGTIIPIIECCRNQMKFTLPKCWRRHLVSLVKSLEYLVCSNTIRMQYFAEIFLYYVLIWSRTSINTCESNVHILYFKYFQHNTHNEGNCVWVIIMF